jgi:hypothetical protein
VDWIRTQYAGKITMLDTWFERVLDRLDRHRLLERTCVIVTTDHGHFLGDHGWMGKPAAPLYDTLCHIPLLIWHPNGVHNDGRVDAITQTVDLYATILELLGISMPACEYIHSRSLAGLIAGGATGHRRHAVYGNAGQRVGITDGEWTLLREHNSGAATAYWYTHHVGQLSHRSWRARMDRRFEFAGLEAGRFIPGLDMPVWRMPVSTGETEGLPVREDLLFDARSDPGQDRNLAAARPAEIARLEDALRKHAAEVGAPEEQLHRLGLR